MAQTRHEISKVQELTYQLRVEDAMNRDVITAPPAMPMSRLRRLLRDKRISASRW